MTSIPNCSLKTKCVRSRMLPKLRAGIGRGGMASRANPEFIR